MVATTREQHSVIPAITVGLASTLVGIGLTRFAYTALIPPVVEAHWFTTSGAVYLGAANLLGYFLGAVTAHPVSERFGARATLAASFGMAALSFLACVHAAPFGWFFFWRLLSGLAGAWLMVVGPAIALAATAADRHPIVGSMMFMGLGLGALLSALVVPALLHAGLWVAWCALGALTLIAGTAGDVALYRLPDPVEAHDRPVSGTSASNPALRWAVALVIIAYACDGIGFVPHTMFWVDYLAREVGQGMAPANVQWALFGLGAMLGPIITRAIVPCIGWRASLTTGFIIKALAVGLPFVAIGIWTRSLSSIVVGALIPGIVALTSGRLAEMVGPFEHKRLWGRATAAFAVAQASAGYGMSGLSTVIGSYRPTFAIGALVLAVAFVLSWLGDPAQFKRRRVRRANVPPQALD
ncbi:putative MFS family arabinose efflux permease [Kushneria sinocarnis]|uniref:Putative MFS family arabinose efflux permease n=1 Tax=Kushneria sinocarnis TaxID=595502 RepID=A0A420WWB0_9GAMM|nr:YbfB/YjiJ family MFS transporter [Kushneria sinocarnis]RKR03373.1 putative MFS family arabinose efflux permease [Kushneria sinocarnis]